MANVQKENGYTAIANEILEALAKTPLNGTQRRILDVVFRYTYGFKRKEHDLSEIFLSNATGIYKRQIQKEIKKLIESNIILITKEASFSSSRKIAFNKNYETWQTPKKTPVVKKDTDAKLDTQPDAKLDTSPDAKLDTQERNIKENIKDIAATIENPVERIANLFFELTGRFANGNDYVSISKITESYSDFETIKKVMKSVTEKKRKKDPSDKIKSFSFFVGAIEDEFKKIEARKAGESIGATERDNKADYDYSKLMYKGTADFNDDDIDF